MQTYLTLDAGVAIKLVVPNPLQQMLIEEIAKMQEEDYRLCAPTLWMYEVSSVFTKLVHFKKMSASTASACLELVHNLEVQLIPPNPQLVSEAFNWTVRLKRAAAYDSFYLALADSLSCDFWTTDQGLFNAVRQPWVRLIASQ